MKNFNFVMFEDFSNLSLVSNFLFRFECKDMLTMCSFAGREFDCCRYAEPIVTNLGKCFTIDLLKSDIEWLKKQTTAGVNGGFVASFLFLVDDVVVLNTNILF